MDFTRKENTAWLNAKIVSRIEDGKELKTRKSFDDFQALQSYSADVQRWQAEIAEHLSAAYKDQSVASTLCPPIAEIDLEGNSWAAVIAHLHSQISNTLENLGRLETLPGL